MPITTVNFNWKARGSVVAAIADRTTIYLPTVVWNSRGQRDYLLIGSFIPKFVFASEHHNAHYQDKTDRHQYLANSQYTV